MILMIYLIHCDCAVKICHPDAIDYVELPMKFSIGVEG